jgi:hypothetical protein
VISRLQASELLDLQPKYIVIKPTEGPSKMIPLVDLSIWLSENDSEDPQQAIDLLELPGERRDLGQISDDASVYDALQEMNRQDVDVLLVRARLAVATELGVITRDDVRNSYRFDNPNK